MNYFIERYGSVWLQAAPFSLSVNTETSESILSKLGYDRTDLLPYESRQSYFLDDFRVVEIVWKEGHVGLEKIWVAHLGAKKDFQSPHSRSLEMSFYIDNKLTKTGQSGFSQLSQYTEVGSLAHPSTGKLTPFTEQQRTQLHQHQQAQSQLIGTEVTRSWHYNLAHQLVGIEDSV